MMKKNKMIDTNQLEWTKSSFCFASNACIEVAKNNNSYFVRDSKLKESPVLTFTTDEWRAFVDGIKKGEFE